MSLDERGILTLEKEVWTLANTTSQLSGFWDMYVGSRIGTNGSILLGQSDLEPDPLSGLEEAVVGALGGLTRVYYPLYCYNDLARQIDQGYRGPGTSIAFILQSLITLLSSITYYDLPAEFDVSATVQTKYWIQATVPVTSRGLIIVTSTLPLHFLLLGIILGLFVRKPRHSRLRGTWAAMAQGSSGIMGQHLAGSCWEDDCAVEKRLKSGRLEKTSVGTRIVGERVEIAIKED
jgi:hypothetical protein